MPKHDLEDLTFLWRETMVHGNATGTVAVISLTVWRRRNGDIIMMPDNPEHLPYVERYIAMRQRRAQ